MKKNEENGKEMIEKEPREIGEKSHRCNRNRKLEGKIDREKKRRNWLEIKNDK